MEDVPNFAFDNNHSDNVVTDDVCDDDDKMVSSRRDLSGLEVINEDSSVIPLSVAQVSVVSSLEIVGDDDKQLSGSNQKTATLKTPTHDLDKKVHALDGKNIQGYSPEKSHLMDGGKSYIAAADLVNGAVMSSSTPAATSGSSSYDQVISPSAALALDPVRRADEESLLTSYENQMTSQYQYAVLDATLVDEVVYDAIPFEPNDGDGKPRQQLGWKKRVFCASLSLIVVAAVATAASIAVTRTSNTNQDDEVILYAQDGLLADWMKCSDSLQCSNGCCSGTFSQGVYRCTVLDGGYLPGTCVGDGVRQEESRGDWVDCNSSLQCTNGCCSNTYSEGFWKCTPLIGGYLGDPAICISHLEESSEWETCESSKECSTGCCSSTYTEGVLKCTPLVGGFRNDTCVGEEEEVEDVKDQESIGDWVECKASLECTNGCCSNTYSEGFWKCTPLIGGYLGDPDICISHAEESKEWDNCTVSEDCGTGCCSSTYSEGVPKCTPLVGGFRNDTCV